MPERGADTRSCALQDGTDVLMGPIQFEPTAGAVAALSPSVDASPSTVGGTGFLAADFLAAVFLANTGTGLVDFVASLASAWKDGQARPTHRKQPTAKHWWKTRVDPFADAWPVVEGWLIAEPAVSTKALMVRLATLVPDAYAGKAHLRTLQRRIKAWRAERAKEMVLGRLRKHEAMLAEV